MALLSGDLLPVCQGLVDDFALYDCGVWLGDRERGRESTGSRRRARATNTARLPAVRCRAIKDAAETGPGRTTSTVRVSPRTGWIRRPTVRRRSSGPSDTRE